MEVVVSGSSDELRVALVGELEDTAPAIVHAAAAVAEHDHVTLLLDTSAAFPRSSPILERIERTVSTATARQRVVVR